MNKCWPKRRNTFVYRLFSKFIPKAQNSKGKFILNVLMGSSLHKHLKNVRINELGKNVGSESNIYLKKSLMTHFVWPIRCTLPIAWCSLAGFSVGSTKITWVASIMFNPLEPSFRGSKITFTALIVLKSTKLAWKINS